MLGKQTLQNAGYAAILIIILTLTGIFGSFERRLVLADTVTLSSVLLIGALLATGFLTGRPQREKGAANAALNGAIGGLVVGAGLVAVILFTQSVNTRFVFANLGDLSQTTLMFGQEDLFAGIIALMIGSGILGALGGLLVFMPEKLLRVLTLSTSLTLVIGILQGQINTVFTFSDAVALFAVFAVSYGVTWRIAPQTLSTRLAIGAGIGVLGGVILAVLANSGGLESGGWLRTGGRVPTILTLAANGNIVFFIIVMTITGIIGAAITRASAAMHNAAWGLLVGLLVLGILSWQRNMTWLNAALTFGTIAISHWMLPPVGSLAETRFNQLTRPEQKSTRILMFLALFGVLIFVPPFAGLSITNTINLTALYVTMGIGLSVMIGFAGLLDLGYVASYAIGAYTIGLLTTPSLLTCGWMTPDEITAAGMTLEAACSGVMTFWQGLIFAVLVSATTGMLLGVPVLRLRGDYLAIVTLGFGEIIQVLIKSNAFKPLLGGAQGIISIPLPHVNLSFLNPEWTTNLSRSTELYYLYMGGALVAIVVVLRLINTRLGRAWRAMREDEDVAEAMGIHLVGTKLLAFGVSSAFAGLGGAIFGTSFQSIFPNSFTLVVSINVLSLIIIGGMGSIPGVILGAFILIGLPEVLRELQDYRLLAFGALLVLVMILKPDGLLPPHPPKLAELAKERQPQGIGD